MKRILYFLIVILLFAATPLYAGQQGHYMPGVMDIRDHVLPPAKGLYYIQYDLYYATDSYYDNDGKKLKNLEANKSVSLNGFNIDVSASADVDVNIASTMIMPMFLYVTDWELLGAKLGFAILPEFGYTQAKFRASTDVRTTFGSIGFQKNTTNDAELDQEKFGFGDLYAQPVFMNWGGEKYDIAFGYGFYAPTGAYSKARAANVGMGFWSHELILGGLYYLDKYRKTALLFNANYEINTKNYEQDLTPGQDVIIEYGFSHYLTPRLEVGATASNIWQTTNSSGTDARNKDQKYYVFGVGGQLAYWFIKDKAYLSGKYNYQYAARNTFGGQSFVLNCIYVF